MNVRVMLTGIGLVGLALAFFLFMAAMAPKSNDPAAMMQTVGTVAGGVGGLGIVMALFGALRKRPAARPSGTGDAVPAPAPPVHRLSLAAYVPLAAAIGEIPWIILLVLCLLFAVGDTPYTNTPQKEHLFQMIGAVPAVAGMLSGIACMLLRSAQGAMQWTALVAGVLACAAWCEAFALGIIR
jgi:hypothetical protein